MNRSHSCPLCYSEYFVQTRNLSVDHLQSFCKLPATHDLEFVCNLFVINMLRICNLQAAIYVNHNYPWHARSPHTRKL